jgi:hypothetical protein
MVELKYKRSFVQERTYTAIAWIYALWVCEGAVTSPDKAKPSVKRNLDLQIYEGIKKNA